MITITDDVRIPEEELKFAFTRSGGPGGQNVNKVNSRVTLTFDLAASGSLTAEQKTLLRRRLRGRLNKGGVLRLVCQTRRSQHANRAEVVERFAALLADALRPPRSRKKTRVPLSAKLRRQAEKRHRSRLKQQRRIHPDESS